jgi:hypothetical protein
MQNLSLVFTLLSALGTPAFSAPSKDPIKFISCPEIGLDLGQTIDNCQIQYVNPDECWNFWPAANTMRSFKTWMPDLEDCTIYTLSDCKGNELRNIGFNRDLRTVNFDKVNVSIKCTRF